MQVIWSAKRSRLDIGKSMLLCSGMRRHSTGELGTALTGLRRVLRRSGWRRYRLERLFGHKNAKKSVSYDRIRKPVVGSWRAVRSTILTEKHLPCTIMSTTITVEIHTCFAINIFYVSGAVVNR